MSSITVDGISKDFGIGNKKTQVLKDLHLEIPDFSFTVLLGPSGCGKSTLLRIIAGLEKPTSGRILLDGVDITNEEPSDRGLAMVFQNYALYPHMTAYGNVEYALKIAKVDKEERHRRVMDALEMVELTDQAKKLPAMMSGGQRQRVALARAIVKKPGVFLMDEPLSNLDAKLRGQMRETITGLYKKLGCTFLYVTHDQVEAMSMGTNIVLLQGGKIMQQGSPRRIYTDPENIYTAGFIGSPPCNILQSRGFQIAIRSEDILPGKSEGVQLQADVHSVEQLGRDSIYNLQTPLGPLQMKTLCTWEEQDDTLEITIPYEKIMYFDEAGKRINPSQEMETALQSYAQELSEQRAYIA